MCLETGMKYAAITDKDIICYKCVNPGEINGLHLHEFGSFYSFYYHFTYEVGKEYELEDDIINDIIKKLQK